MADQLKGMLKKIEMEQKLQVAGPPLTRDSSQTLLDKLSMNNCTYFLTEIQKPSRNRVIVLCELLRDVGRIAQYNVERYGHVVQRREIDELLEEQKKLEQVKKMIRELQDKLERQLAESARGRKVTKKIPSKGGSKLDGGTSDRRAKERDKKNVSKLSAMTQQKSSAPGPSKSLQVTSLSSNKLKKSSKPSSPIG